MQRIFLIIVFISAANISFSQSKTFQTLKQKFGGSDNVYAFSASGFFARTILWLAGEHDFRDAVQEIKSIRLITIPKAAFEASQVTVNGLKKLVKKDYFEELANVKDHGDNVSLYLQQGKSEKQNRYLLLVDSSNDVVVIEIRGYIDPAVMNKQNKLSFN